MKWHWYSTVKSTNNNEFSILALLESIAAVLVSLWVAWYFQTLTYMILSVIISPFLLLRTNNSTSLGLYYFKIFVDKEKLFFEKIWRPIKTYVDGKNLILFKILMIIPSIVYIMVFFSIFLIGSLLIKTFVTIFSCFKQPIQCIKQIPNNWRKIVFCVDIMHYPEPVPGVESEPNKIIYAFSNLHNDAISYLQREFFIKIIGIIYIIILYIISFPSYIYRWSLKSSSIIWLPLIFIIGDNDSIKDIENKRLQYKLKVIYQTELGKIKFYYAIFVIFVLTLLPISITGQIENWLIKKPFIETLFGNLLRYLLAFQMESWHLSRFVAALLTVFLYIYAERLLIKLTISPSEEIGYAPYIIRLVQVLRVPLTLFTVGCGFYLLISPIDWQSQFNNMQWLPFDNLR